MWNGARWWCVWKGRGARPQGMVQIHRYTHMLPPTSAHNISQHRTLATCLCFASHLFCCSFALSSPKEKLPDLLPRGDVALRYNSNCFASTISSSSALSSYTTLYVPRPVTLLILAFLPVIGSAPFGLRFLYIIDAISGGMYSGGGVSWGVGVW